MKRQIIYLLFVLFALSWQTKAQVSIGSDTSTNQGLPIEPFYGYSYSQVIYLQSEINASGDITTLTWDFAGSSISNSNDWTIYMGHTTKSEFSSTSDWIDVSTLTQVYSGTVSVDANNKVVVDITDFTYNNTDNLVIAVDENASSYNETSDDFNCSAVSGNRGLIYRNDSTNPDPVNPPTASYRKQYIANIVLGGITQACPTPSNGTNSNVTTISADFDWTENGSAGSWTIEYKAGADFTPGTGAEDGSANPTTHPSNIGSLSANTTYYWYVRADCSASESSTWAGPYTFTTLCNPFTASYTENFDGVSTPDLPSCWHKIVDATSSYASIETTSTNNSSPNGAKLYNSNDSNATLMLISPQFSDLTSQGNRIRFYAKGSSNGYDLIIGTMSDPFDQSTFTAFTTITLTDAFTEYTVNFDSNYTGSDQFIVFKHGLGGTYRSIYIDDFVYEPMPSCPAPSSLSASNITDTQADLSWTTGGASDWEIVVQPVGGGAPSGSGTAVSGTATYTALGLTADTDYEFYVRDYCNPDYSVWTGPYTFTTLCNPFTASYTENFDGVSTPDLPSCWHKIVDATSSYASIETTSTNNSSPNGAKLYNSNDSNATLMLISPQFSDLTSQGNRIRFYAKGSSNGYDLIIGTMSDPFDQSTFTAFTTITLTDAFTEYTVNFDSNYTGSDQFIVFKHGLGGTYRSIYIDDFVYEPIPACPEPTDLSASNITTTTADLSWNGSANMYNVEIVTHGTQPTGTPTASGITSPYTASNLTSNTSYDYYVQADCGGSNGTSTWAGPYTFTTDCAVESVPWAEGFENNFNFSCWDNVGTSSYIWETNDGGTHGPGNTTEGTQAIMFDVYNASRGKTATATTPTFDMTILTNPQLSFDYWMNGSADNDLWLKVEMTTDGSTWNQIFYQEQDGTIDSWTTVELPLTGINATTKFRFIASSDYGLYNIFVDNLIIDEGPSCPSPTDMTASNISAEQADLTWNPGSVNVFNIEIGVSGFTPTGTPTYTGVVTPYTATGLSSNTTYDYYIQSDCGNGDVGVWKGPFTFTTMPACGDTFYDDGGASGTYSNGLYQTFTIYPDNPGDVVTVTFNSFNTEQGWDSMMIYNGPDETYPIFDSGSTYSRNTCPDGAWTGAPGDTYTADGQSFTSTDASGALTLVFATDSGGVRDGWEAVVSCAAPPCPSSYTPYYAQDFTFDYLTRCWSESNQSVGAPSNNNDSNWKEDGWLNDGTDSGAASINMYAGNDRDWLISPKFDLSAGGYELRVDVAVTHWKYPTYSEMGEDDKVVLKYTTDGSTWYDLMTWDKQNQPDHVGRTEVIDLANVIGSNVRFAFYADEGGDQRHSYKFYVDNFIIKTKASCAAPTGLTVVSAANGDAEVSWTDNSSGNASYTVEWRKALTSAWSSATVPSGNTFTITGLTSSTEYEWRLLYTCDNDPGLPVNGENFMMDCSVLTPPYTQDFATYLPDCWREGNQGEVRPESYSDSGWRDMGYLHNGTTGAAAFNMYAGNDRDWLISPAFDLTGGSYELSVDVGVSHWQHPGYSDMGDDDEVVLKYSTDGGQTWLNLMTWDKSTQPDNNGRTEVVDLANVYGSNVMFAFFADEGADQRLSYFFYVDNFSITPVSTARPVAEVNIGQRANEFKVATKKATDNISSIQVFDLTGLLIYKNNNVNNNNHIVKLNVNKGSVLIFKIGLNNDTEYRVIKKIYME